MKLRDLAGNAFPELKAELEGPAGALDISGLSSDSRKIAPGMAFVAIAGSKADGAGFIADAVAKGAAVVIASHAAETPVPVLVVAEPRRFLSVAASHFYGRQPATMVPWPPPRRIAPIEPGSAIENTMIGSDVSRARANAVASITL